MVEQHSGIKPAVFLPLGIVVRISTALSPPDHHLSVMMVITLAETTEYSFQNLSDNIENHYKNDKFSHILYYLKLI